MNRAGLVMLLLAGSASPAFAVAGAVADKYHVTPAEKIACTRDAMRLCFGTYPDEDKLLDCMKTNVNELTPMCKTAFVAGMRRRGIR